jgi:hypothetical protein
VAGIAEGDPVADHWCPAEQPRALHGVFAEAVADRVDCGLKPLIARPDLPSEQAHLPGVRVRQPGEPHTERADLAPRLARRQQLQRGSIDLLSGGDGDRQRHLL